MIQRYNWQRRWFPRYITTNKDKSAASFESTWQLQVSSVGMLFEEIRYVPVLLLLGEPGIGKSVALKSEFERLHNALLGSQDETVFIDLQGFDTATYVDQKLFRSNEKYSKWKQGTHNLTLFLDSLDRALIPVSTVIQVIANELRDVEVARLSLRIACRDIDWSITIADNLREIWDFAYKNSDYPLVQVYQLAPLSFQDIAIAAEINEISPQEFLNSVKKFDALALASIPITLEMLLNRFPDISDNRLELFREGCKFLCTKVSLSSQELFSTEIVQRLEVASRIAVVMILSNNYSIKIDEGDTRYYPSTLPISDLLLDQSSNDEERLVREALSTSLFSGTERRMWVHQSFAEFLAAYYISSHNIQLADIINITTSSDGSFVPQLHETIRWLAIMRNDVFQEVISRHPALMLSVDLTNIAKNDFQRLLDYLLNLEDEYQYVVLLNDLRQYSLGINHPNIGEFLSPYLSDKQKSVHLRRFVITLIDRFKLNNFDNELLTIMFDIDEEFVLRRLAADALYGTGSETAKRKMKPFIYDREDDPDDELKGYALLSLYPDNLTTQELFSVLTPPKQDNYFGSYSMFLHSEKIIPAISVDDLPIALQWVAQQPRQHEQNFSFQDISNAIIRKGWDYIKQPHILDAFAKTALAILLRHDDIFGERSSYTIGKSASSEYIQKFYQQTTERRSLVIATIPFIIQHNIESHILFYRRPSYIVREDLDWLVQQLEITQNTHEKRIWAQLVTRILRNLTGYNFNTANLDEITHIYETSENNPILAAMAKDYFVSILSEPYIIKLRQDYYENKKYEEEYRIPPHDPPPLERINAALDEIDKGNIGQWQNVIAALMLKPEGGQFWYQFDPDVTDFPSWEVCDTGTRERIIQAARNFILQQPEVVENDWFGTNEIPYIELFGYLAIFLTLKFDNEFLAQVSTDRWVRWSHIIIWYPFRSGIRMDREEKDRYILELQKALLCYVYRAIPHQIISNLLDLIDKKNEQQDSFYELYKFDQCFDNDLDRNLAQKASEDTLTAKARLGIIEFLLKHQSFSANNIAEKIISNGYANDEEKSQLIEVACSLMRFPTHLNWDVIWELMQIEPEIGKNIVEKVADWDYRRNPLAQHLQPKELADLYIWLEEQYPKAEDPQIRGVHAVSSREQVGHFRDSFMMPLKENKNPEAIAQIERIVDTFPEQDGLQFIRVEIQRNLQEISWNPPMPCEVLTLGNIKDITDKTQSEIFSSTRTTKSPEDRRWLIGIVVSILIAIVTILTTFIVPEVREIMGLDTNVIPIEVEESTDEPEPDIIVETTISPESTETNIEITEESLQPEATQESN